MVVLVDVRDPGNAGTVLRAVDASGSTAVVYAADSVDPYNPKTVRASAGSVFHVPLGVRHDSLTLAAELSAAGFRTLATVVRGRRRLRRARLVGPDRPVPRQRVLGARPRAERRVVGGSLAIPMAGRAESLNVGVACAVVCFEAFRQRRGGGPGPRSISGGGTTRHGD